MANHEQATVMISPICPTTLTFDEISAIRNLFGTRVQRTDMRSLQTRNFFEDASQYLQVARAAVDLLDLQCQDILSSFESFVIFIFQAIRANTATDVALALAAWAKTLLVRHSAVYGTSPNICTLFITTALDESAQVCDVVSGDVDFVSYLGGFVKRVMDLFAPDERPRFQSFESNLEELRLGISKAKAVRDSPVLQKVHNVFVECLSRSFFDQCGITFDSLGYSKMAKDLAAKTQSSSLSLIAQVFDTLVHVLSKFVQCAKSKSMTPLLFSEMGMVNWMKEHDWLCEHAPFYTQLASLKVSQSEFDKRLDDTIDRGEMVDRNSFALAEAEKKFFRKCLSGLKRIRNDLRTKGAAREQRDAPFSVLLHGGSSIAKSHLTTIVQSHVAQALFLPSGPEFVYTMPAESEFMDGLKAQDHTIILDDVAIMNPSLGQMDGTLKHIIQVINNVVMIANMASLEEKGRIPVRPKIVIGTTNQIDLNAHAYFSNPVAVQRRFPVVVDVKVKPEFAVNGVQIDPSKMTSQAGAYDDYWLFDVYSVEPVENSRGAKLRLVCEFSCIDDFLEFLAKKAIVHFQNQAHKRASEQNVVGIKICHACHRRADRCAENGDCDTLCSVCSKPLRECAESQCSGNPFAVRQELHFQTHVTTAAITLGVAMATWASVTHLCKPWSLMELTAINTVRNIGAKLAQSFLPLSRVLRVVIALATALALATYSYRVLRGPPGPPPPCADKNCVGQKAEEHADQMVDEYARDLDQDKRSKTRAMRLGLGGLAALGALNMVPQFRVVTTGVAPEPRANEPVNVWKKHDFHLQPFTPSLCQKSWNSLPEQQLISKISHNLLRVMISADGKTWRDSGLIALGGNLFALNSHSVPQGDALWFKIEGRPKEEGVCPNTIGVICRNQIGFIPNHDIAFVHIPFLPPFNDDIYRLLMDVDSDGQFTGKYVSMMQNGIVRVVGVKAIKRSHEHYVGDPMSDGYVPVIDAVGWSGTCDVSTVDGDCGSVLLSFTAGGPVLLGFHTLGGPGRHVWAIRLLKQHVDSARSLCPEASIRCGQPRLQMDGTERHLQVLHAKSPLRFAKSGFARVFGTLTGHRANTTSKVERTCIADAAEGFGYVQKFFPPALNGWEPRYHGLVETLAVKNVIRQDYLQDCVTAFKNDIRESGVRLDKPYDLFTAINGVPGVAYVDGINRNSSVGFPCGGTKRRFLVPVVDSRHPDACDVVDCIKERCDEILESYRQGICVHPVFEAHLKDEARKPGKMPRVFGGAEFAWSLVVRMYFLPIVREMQTNRLVFEGAPGTNAHSIEWSQLFGYLTQHGEDRIVAGDYKAFDKSMPANMILAAFEVLIWWADQEGYSEEDVRVMRCIAMDTAHPTFNYFGDLVQFSGSNPSGYPLTVTINGIVNALYMRYAYRCLSPFGTCMDFKINVALMTYGDDNVMGVSDRAPWFNHTSIQALLAAHGITYTMADKTTESIPYIHISTVSFLKRSWRFEPEIGCHACPLELDSIEKSLMVGIPSASVSREHQAAQVVEMANLEYFFHGKEVFESCRKNLEMIVAQCNLGVYMQGPLATWGELCIRFKY